MNIKTAFSVKTDPQDVVAEIQAQLKDFDPKLIVFFASSAFAPAEIAEQMEAAFPSAETFGCSTAGEIVTGKMLTKSVVAMAFNKQAIKDSKVEVIEDLNKESFRAFNAFQRHFGKPMAQLDPHKYVGLILIDGLSGKEELVMDRMGDLTNVTFIGGSAGDDLKFTNTYVYANGKSYSNAAVLAILEPGVEFSFVKTQSFCELPQKLWSPRRTSSRGKSWNSITSLPPLPMRKRWVSPLPTPRTASCTIRSGSSLKGSRSSAARSRSRATRWSSIAASRKGWNLAFWNRPISSPARKRRSKTHGRSMARFRESSTSTVSCAPWNSARNS